MKSNGQPYVGANADTPIRRSTVEVGRASNARQPAQPAHCHFLVCSRLHPTQLYVPFSSIPTPWIHAFLNMDQ